MPFQWFCTGIATVLALVSPEGVQVPWTCLHPLNTAFCGGDLWHDSWVMTACGRAARWPPNTINPNKTRLHPPAENQQTSSTIKLTVLIVSSQRRWRPSLFQHWQQLFDSPRCVGINLELIWVVFFDGFFISKPFPRQVFSQDLLFTKHMLRAYPETTRANWLKVWFDCCLVLCICIWQIFPNSPTKNRCRELKKWAEMKTRSCSKDKTQTCELLETSICSFVFMFLLVPACKYTAWGVAFLPELTCDLCSNWSHLLSISKIWCHPCCSCSPSITSKFKPYFSVPTCPA